MMFGHCLSQTSMSVRREPSHALDSMKLALMRRDRSAASVPRGSFKRTVFVWRICHWVSKRTLKVYTGDEVLLSRNVMILK